MLGGVLVGRLAGLSAGAALLRSPVGGDDFVSLHCAADWERRVKRVLERFAAESQALVDPVHWRQGGYVCLGRQGQESFHPVCSLSAGVLPLDGSSQEDLAAISQTMAELKRMAKRKAGNSYFVERRTKSEAEEALPAHLGDGRHRLQFRDALSERRQAADS